MNGDLVIFPGTGELLDLQNMDQAALIRARAELADLASRLAAVKTAVNQEIIRRIDSENAVSGAGYTWRAHGWKVTVPSPAARGELRAIEFRLALIANHPELDFDALFQRKVTYTLRVDRWNALTKQRPELEAIRDEHTAPARRDVKITALPTLRPAIEGSTVDD
jgi:hypothetical protein